MHLVFADDFGGIGLNGSKWDTCYWWSDRGNGCTIYGTNGEEEWYLPSQVAVSDGQAHLTATRGPTAGLDVNGMPQIYPWRSGMVTTFRSFSFTYGYIAVKARVPRGSGFWSVLWLLPEDKSGPPEIDLAEVFGFDTNTLSTTYHRPGDTGVFGSPGSNAEVLDLSKQTHTYALDWEPRSLTWSLDGKTVYRYEGETPAKPMYFLANLAVATFLGVGPTPLTPSTASMDIDGVAVYQR